MTRAALIIVVGVVVGSPAARADAREHRLGVSALGSVGSAEAGGADAAAPLGAAEVQYGYGWTNSVELGGTLTLLGGRAVFEDAVVDMLPGSMVDNVPGDLHATVLAGVATLDVRLVGGIELGRAFYRTHPYVSVGAGVLTRLLTGQELIDPEPADPDRDSLGYPASAIDVRPVVRLSLGVERRMSGGFALAADAGIVYAGDVFASAQLGVELVFYWY